MHKIKPDKEAVMIFVLVVGLVGFFYFYGSLAYGQYFYFTYQGEPDPLASIQPGPPIPSMSVDELLRVLIPACMGLVASAVYVFLSLIYFIRKRIFLKLIWAIAGLDITARILLLITTPICRPLPTLSQNILAGIFHTGPFIICGFFSISLFFILRED